MVDFSTVNEFRKQKFNEIHQDPTYISFFLLFDFQSENSPIFNGEAANFLENVLQDKPRATALNNFKNILQKINKKLPWYWQSLTGLEQTKTFGEMKEPYRGAEKPQLEIECLENVEFTILGLIDLYRRACFDYRRAVEVLPRNLRYFTMWVFVTELRTFQATTADHILSSNLKNESNTEFKDEKEMHQRFTSSAKPFFQTRLDYCEFNPDSSIDTFSELQKNPENAAANVSIFWNKAEQVNQQYLTSLLAGDSASDDLTSLDQDRGRSRQTQVPIDPSDQNVHGEEGTEEDDNTISDAQNPFQSLKAAGRNLKRGVTGGPGIENVHGSQLTGAARAATNSVGESLLGDLLLNNVHGIDRETRIENAIDIASINGIENIHNKNEIE